MTIRKAVTALLLASALGGVAHAETLRGALEKAYRSNPTLTGARAQLRAVDENVALARARTLPGVSVTGGYNENVVRTNSFASPARNLSGGLSLSVPLYQGGALRNGLRGADARDEAGRAQLRDTEATLFSQVVGAYMDVIRDEAIVSLNDANIRVLSVNVEATRDRFRIGDLTRTDVAQSESRLALARGQLEQSQAQLVSSRENYVRLVGDAPGVLEPPPPLPNLPNTPDRAVQVALDNNPGLLAATRSRDASRFDTSVARASRLPRLAAVGTSNYANYLGSLNSGVPGISVNQSGITGGVGLQMSVPLFQGGAGSAQIRQAQARESQAIEQITLVERNVVAQTRSSLANYRASNALIASSETAVAAAELSLEGVRAENSVGNRTILDILNAEQELLNAKVQLVSARRNSYVAGFSLLAAIGKAEARDLGLEGGTLYDPVQNYNRLRRHLNDFDSDPTPAPVATRTVDTPAQTPALSGVGPR